MLIIGLAAIVILMAIYVNLQKKNPNRLSDNAYTNRSSNYSNDSDYSMMNPIFYDAGGSDTGCDCMDSGSCDCSDSGCDCGCDCGGCD